MGAEEHYCEGNKEYPIGAFAEDEHREDNADKWCNGIECRRQEGVEDCFMEFAGHAILNLGVKIRKKAIGSTNHRLPTTVFSPLHQKLFR